MPQPVAEPYEKQSVGRRDEGEQMSGGNVLPCFLVYGAKVSGKTHGIEYVILEPLPQRDVPASPELTDGTGKERLPEIFRHIYSQHLGGEISYYHDRYGLECDAVLHLRDGRYALIEMKLGSREIEEGASHLRKLKALIQEHNLKEPSFLMVITGGQFAYRREDGVLIVPIGCLKP